MGMKNMNINRNKSRLSTIALILILAISATLATLSTVTAQTGKATVCYLGAMPNPVGKGQTVLMHVGITDQLGSPELGWVGLSITITDPEGGVTTIEDITTDSTGGTGKTFEPDKVGMYTLQAHFPEQAQRGTTYLASESPEVQLEVQEEEVPVYPGHSLPSNYWTRPVDAQLREWSAITGSWPLILTNLYAPYNDGPETAHILWTKVLTQGGLAGGELGGASFEIGDAYEGKWTGSSGTGSYFESTSIILTGKLYYQESDQENPIVYHCVDLHTGEELWSKVFMNNATIAFGQTYHFDGINFHGAFEYLWVASGWGAQTWYGFDSLTGVWMMTIENVPSGNNIYGPSNEICRYTINTRSNTVSFWNSSEVVLGGLSVNSAGSWGSNAHGRTHDGANGVMWTETIESGLGGSAAAYFLNDRIIGASVSTTAVSLWGINVNASKGAIGGTLFKNTWNAPAKWAEMQLSVSGMQSGWVTWSQEDLVGVLWVKDVREHYGFSLSNGENLWSTPSQNYMDAFDDTPASARAVAYGRFYSASVSGIVYCYDIQTGDLLWKYEAVDPYSEYLFGNTWWLKPLFITDGKIYVATLEHSPIDPRPRGGPFICLNATTDNPEGEVIWRINGAFRQTRWGGRAIIGDSIIATMDTYDQRVYAIGKGASATTVTATPKVAAKGSGIVIEGTVMDVSPGTKDLDMQLRFPKGVPAISDADMSDWMLYVYKQFEMPENATGVTVVFNWVDSDGVWHDLDRTKTDTSGTFSYVWYPDTEGTCKIIATFEGSGGYYGSRAVTTVTVGAPEQHIPTAAEIGDTTVSKLPAYPAASDIAQETINKLPAYLTIDLVVLIVAIVVLVIGLLAYMTLRKRK
jgi:outer membrane protein assembly factor BamB